MIRNSCGYRLSRKAVRFFLVGSVTDPPAGKMCQVLQIIILTCIHQDPRWRMWVKIGGELGEKLGTILKTPLMMRGRLDDANAR